MTPNLYFYFPTLLFHSQTLFSSTPKVFFHTPTLLSCSPKMLFSNPDLHSSFSTLLTSTLLINYSTLKNILTNYNYRINKTQLYTTNGLLVIQRTSCGQGTKTQHEVHVALQPINAGELQLKKNIEAMELAACFPALRDKWVGCRFERRMKRRLF